MMMEEYFWNRLTDLVRRLAARVCKQGVEQ